MRTPALALALAATVLATVRADGVLEVVSTPPASVYLDGEMIGQTPLTASNIPAGDHQIMIENPTTGEAKTYVFHSPKAVSVSKRLEADFTGTTVTVAPPPPPAQRIWTTTTYQPQPVVVTGPPPPPPSPYGPHRSAAERDKVRTRNALLGLTVASQVLVGGHGDRQHARNVGLGLTLLNEIMH